MPADGKNGNAAGKTVTAWSATTVGPTLREFAQERDDCSLEVATSAKNDISVQVDLRIGIPLRSSIPCSLEGGYSQGLKCHKALVKATLRDLIFVARRVRSKVHMILDRAFVSRSRRLSDI